ncbi:AMP-binding protein [Haliea sp. E17]|uniref:AMP-binding protein n=1 Tax=Haliea sp. E17 TaxID=3401576 RepID=UPI003AB004CE
MNAATRLDFPSPLHALAHWVEVQGDSTYLTQPLADGSVIELSWRQVDEQARRLASYLLALGLPPRSNIILSGKNCAHWVIADLAIWMAGHVSVPIYPTLNAQTTQYILEHCAAGLFFVGRLGGVDDSWNEVREIIPAQMPLVRLPDSPEVRGQTWENIQREYPPLATIEHRGVDDLATIVYTSGTTGRPKGVMHSFHSLTAPCRSTAEVWHPSPTDRMLSYLPLAHVAERVAVEMPSLVFGFPLFFNLSLETFAADLKRARPTRFFSVPRLWTKFYQTVNAHIPPSRQRLLFSLPLVSGVVKRKILTQLGLDAARLCFTGAAPMPSNILQWYRGLGLELLDVFGMSENAATSHASPPGAARPGYVGVPLPGVECRIDESGEVLVKSPGQMLGYYRMEEVSNELLTGDGFFRTGDRGVISDDGYLKITGRVKELFKTSKGKYVAPVPIENKLAAHPFVEVSCATGPGEPQPFALVVLSPELDLAAGRERIESELAALVEGTNQSLEEHERLDYLVVVNEPWTIQSGMLTPTMKLRREAVEDRYLHRAEEWREMQRKVIWE